MKQYPKSSKIPNNEIGDLINSRTEMLQRLDNLLKEKRSLIRILSHDLYNLIAAVNGSLQLIKIKLLKDSKDIMTNLNNIEKAVHRQIQLIETIKELDSVESGKKELELSAVNVKEVIDEALA